jgi:F-type H+-transporting ATPase subunit b
MSRSPRKPQKAQGAIAEIQANATQSVEDVARDVAGDVVTAILPGQTVDADAIASAVTARMKG